jgi:hypothetical protein
MGRPRWLEDVQNDLRVLKTKMGRLNSNNSEQWASVRRETRVLIDR